MAHTPIHQIQGPGLFSPLRGKTVSTQGVVIGSTRKGFFIQDPEGDPRGPASIGLFVYQRRRKPRLGSLVRVSGKVVDYQAQEGGRPTTQLAEKSTEVVSDVGSTIEPVWLTAERVLAPHDELVAFLNGLEGMLVGVAAGATFVAPSNPFGDYVVLPPDAEVVRTQQGGVLIDPERPNQWLPGFRITNYAEAPTVHVGSTLREAVVGPLNFRVASFQMAAAVAVLVDLASVSVESTKLRGEGAHLTVLTLNGFNLDTRVEDPALVDDGGRDVDDDIGDLRFIGLGEAIVTSAGCPWVVALQEIQDDDGAEISGTVTAGRTYDALIASVRRAGGPTYAWAGIPPEEGADGGQPGGNIRNGFLYDPSKVQVVEGSLHRLGVGSPVYEGSRKPLAARFRLVEGDGEVEIINVHLASKRHQSGLFAPENPGVDPRHDLRIEQVREIGVRLAELRKQRIDYYVTGDFNDFEFSDTLRALTGDHSTNLVDRVPQALRHDYNHRGLSEALMHGVVANRQLDGRTAVYEILHANPLTGVRPGRQGGKASDHGYAIARLELGSPG